MNTFFDLFPSGWLVWRRGLGCFLAAVLGCCLVSATGLAGELTPVEIATRLQEAYDSTRTLEADFRQVAEVAMSGRKRYGEGKMAILKPGRIRWDYYQPDRQVLLSDGEKFVMYFAKSNQMIIQSITEYLTSDVTYSFFTGAGNILRDFEVLAAERDAGEGTLAVKLVPRKPHPQVDYLHIWVTRDDFTLKGLEVVDQFGSITNLQFLDIRLNQEIPEEYFVFTPPPDTEIISQ
jgi:outer membrane lipoprotein carrier protein